MLATLRGRVTRTGAIGATAVLAATGLFAVSGLEKASASVTSSAPSVSIATLQQEVVSQTYQAAITASTDALAKAQASLATADDTLRTDEADVSEARATEAADQTKTAQATVALAAATAKRAATHKALTDDRSDLSTMALADYVGGAVAATPSRGESLSEAQQQVYVSELVSATTGVLQTWIHDEVIDLGQAIRTEASDTTELAADQQTLAQAEQLSAQGASILNRDETSVGSLQVAVNSDQAAATSAQAEQGQAEQAVTGADPATPTILGPSALTAAQLTAWYGYSGYADFTSTPINQLASWYVSEGAAEGVRGDIAFAQAIVETGGFSSPDAINANNYAGIGHCDSCAGGLPFSSAENGVDAQVQLLATTAQPALTTAELGQPLASSELAPEDQPLRGCCQTWTALTGKWATDPNYGQTILSVYAEMLEYTLDTG